MLISVIIPTCNRNDLLAKCLELLSPANQTINEGYEVFVADDSKANIAKGLVEEKYNWAKWIEGPKKGPASNRNYGAKFLNSEWIVFIDDDCLPEKDILNNYKKAIEHFPSSLAFEGTIVPDDWDLMKKEMAECPINMDGGCFWSANICVKKSLFLDIGGFDELFLIPAQEDQDIYERLREHTNIPFLKNCVVVHPVRFGSVKKKLSRIRIEFANWIYYTEKHSPVSIKKHLFKSVFDYARMSAKNIVQFKFKLLLLNSVKSLYCLYLCIVYKKAKTTL
jgi:GT2 family glycosyltransferase